MQSGANRTQYLRRPKPWRSCVSVIRYMPFIEKRIQSRQEEDEVNTRSHAHRELRLGHVSISKGVALVTGIWARRWAITICLVTFCVWLSVGIRVLASSQESSVIVSNYEGSAGRVPEDASGGDQKASPDGVKQIGSLATTFLPAGVETTTEGHKRRLIFIGDIHGCFEELVHLLEKAEYNEATDHIITTGDMVNKGPNSGAVVDFLISQGASCVRGNHDDKILRKAAQAKARPNVPVESEDRETLLAKSLTDAQLAYLQSCPVVLNVGQVPGYGKIVVVHGGLVPSLELADQDAWSVMNMRVIHPLTHVPSKDHNLATYLWWADVWNQCQERRLDGVTVSGDNVKQMLDSHVSTTIIYGHDARRGLQIQKYTKGLDSNCVRGHQLTALVLGTEQREHLVQVQCRHFD